MATLCYNAQLRMLIADEPFFQPEVAAATPERSYADPVPIQEGKNYYIKFYGDDAPEWFQKAPFVVKKFPGLLFEINFRNYVGLTRIGPIHLRVKNSKIGDDLFQSMLDFIADRYINLIFNFANSTVGQSYSKEKPGPDIAYVEYLFLKKFLLDQAPNIDGIIAAIISNPHHRLHREVRDSNIENIQHLDPNNVMEVVSDFHYLSTLRNDHPLLKTTLGSILFHKTGRRLYPAKVKEESKYLELDNNENRFVKHLLEDVRTRLARFTRLLNQREEREGYLNPKIPENVAVLKAKLDTGLANPLWKEMGRMSFVPTNSQVLQRKEGYRQLFQLHSLLHLVTRYNFCLNFEYLLETKNAATLFEYWCFFVIKEILDQTRKPVVWKPIVPEHPLEQHLSSGISIEYGASISLSYNKRFSGSPSLQPQQEFNVCYNPAESYSHFFKPDIVISRGDWKLILDAKYKGKMEEDEFYGGSGGSIQSPKDEDINKMHTYREAINKVFGAYVLYVGTEPAIYRAHDARHPYEGVGALPLKPKSGGQPEQIHREYLADLINKFLNS